MERRTVEQEKRDVRMKVRDLYYTANLTAYVANVVRQVAEHEVFVGATSVLVYEPMQALEIPFVGELMRQFPEKRWYVPEVVSDEEMVFVRKDTGQQTASLTDNRQSDLYRVTPKTCVLVPALALDKNGNRLGKGRGYYDRFLHAHESLQPKTLSVVPDFAFFDTVPTDDHDVRVQYSLCARA